MESGNEYLAPERRPLDLHHEAGETNPICQALTLENSLVQDPCGPHLLPKGSLLPFIG